MSTKHYKQLVKVGQTTSYNLPRKYPISEQWK